MSSIYDQLQSKITELEQIRKVKEHILVLQERLNAELRVLAIMEKALDKEQRDVELLEQGNLHTMVRKFIGDREEKLEKERDEYIRASLRYNELFKSVELIRYELDILTKKAQDIENVQKQIEFLMGKREDELMETDPVASGMLRRIHSESDRLTKYSVEIEEAYEAGQLAFGHIRKIENFIVEAKQGELWFQTLYHAREMAAKAKHVLIHFIHELKDIYPAHHFELHIEIENDGNFADLYYEMINAFVYNRKINKSLENIRHVKAKVENILDQLATEKANTKLKLTELDSNRKQIIIQDVD